MAGLDPTVDNGLYLVFRPDLFVERYVFDDQVSQLIADLHESSKVTGTSPVRLPGEESQQRKAELLQIGTIEIEELLYEFLLAR
jgi:LDH2 family malate/lactate/ureidoglycolate dehydrogenase